MTSTKASSKRAALTRRSDYTKQFLKDWERVNRTGRQDMMRLKEAMLLLIANDSPLGAEWQNHNLKGEWAGFQECHIGGDFLLIYHITSAAKIESVVFVRAGSHAELFGI